MRRFRQVQLAVNAYLQADGEPFQRRLRAFPRSPPMSQAAYPVTRILWQLTHPDLRRSPRVRAMSDCIAGIVHDAASLLK